MRSSRPRRSRGLPRTARSPGRGPSACGAWARRACPRSVRSPRPRPARAPCCSLPSVQLGRVRLVLEAPGDAGRLLMGDDLGRVHVLALGDDLAVLGVPVAPPAGVPAADGPAADLAPPHPDVRPEGAPPPLVLRRADLALHPEGLGTELLPGAVAAHEVDHDPVLRPDARPGGDDLPQLLGLHDDVPGLERFPAVLHREPDLDRLACHDRFLPWSVRAEPPEGEPGSRRYPAPD